MKKIWIVQFTNPTNCIPGKKIQKKKEKTKTHVLLENNQTALMPHQKRKKTPTKLLKLKRNKVVNR